MKLYRMDVEWDEYLGAGEYRTHVSYKYVLGNSRLGKEVYKTLRNEERIRDVVILNMSLKGLWVCWRGVVAEQYNQTCWSWQLKRI